MNLAFSTALSGLSADSTAINVVGNDLANLNTTGYKATELNFSDLMSQTLGGAGSQVGMGIGQVSSFAKYTQGSLQNTSGPTDAAIQGNGFFVVKDSNNQQLYTRDGAFQVNSSGQLTTASGELVQGWNSLNSTVNTNAPISTISVPLGATIPATATTTMKLGVNLDSRGAVGTTSGSFSAPMQVVDSQGNTHTLTISFTKTAANAWDYSVSIPASDLTTGGTTTLTSGSLTFDANGQLTSPASTTDPQTFTVAGLADGAADMPINWNLYDATSGNSLLTQVAASAGVASTWQDGLGAGQISNVSLQNGGLLVANYSNGKQLTVGQLAVASISNPDSLSAVGDNNLAATSDTAAPSIGTANSGSRGQIVAGSLESSTVDIAQEFTNLLTFERGYQANSRVITASDQILQETVNLIHP
ncbi:MAG TPA: flagellar hook protein FlgE [Bryobacteraceae bacterium]|nr:flagellar hook protein FlgE [Bryobacteraceae bacterium]